MCLFTVTRTLPCLCISNRQITHCSTQPRSEDSSCPDYKAFLIFSKGVLCDRHDTPLDPSSVIDGIRVSAEERLILAGFQPESEDRIWGKRVGDSLPSNTRKGARGTELEVLQELIRWRSNSNQNDSVAWNGQVVDETSNRLDSESTLMASKSLVGGQPGREQDIANWERAIEADSGAILNIIPNLGTPSRSSREKWKNGLGEIWPRLLNSIGLRIEVHRNAARQATSHFWPFAKIQAATRMKNCSNMSAQSQSGAA